MAKFSDRLRELSTAPDAVTADSTVPRVTLVVSTFPDSAGSLPPPREPQAAPAPPRSNTPREAFRISALRFVDNFTGMDTAGSGWEGPPPVLNVSCQAVTANSQFRLSQA
ncbi:hypothetical protein HerbRD11066_41120 [Herbidospora sp. RD11066]